MARTNETPSWYAQADRIGTYNRRNRNMRPDAARSCRYRYGRDILAGSVTTTCFHSAFCPQTVAFPTYAYQEGVSLVPAHLIFGSNAESCRARPRSRPRERCSSKSVPPLRRRGGWLAPMHEPASREGATGEVRGCREMLPRARDNRLRRTVTGDGAAGSASDRS